jgi:hypothetical protein
VNRSLVRERAYEGLLEICHEFLDECVPDDGCDGHSQQVKRDDEEKLCGACCACAAIVWIGSGDWRDDLAHALGEGGWVELGAQDLVRAVGHDGDAPVADEGDELLVLSGFDL